MTIEMDGLGSQRCIWVMPSGRSCQFLEVEGLEYCLRHMPDDRVDEAEQVTGVLRCHAGPGGRYSCREIAQSGTDHCPMHNPARKRKAEVAALNSTAVELAGQIIKDHAADLEHPDPVTDPYGELMDVAGELRAWKDILRGMVVALERRFRYSGKAGEQTRAEVVLYNQALKDFAQVLLAIGRLNLDARLVGIQKQTAEMLDRALDAALERAGIGFEAKDEARKVFREGIRIVA